MSVTTTTVLYKEDSDIPHALLRPPFDDWGLIACDLVAPPRRFWSDGGQAPPLVDPAIDFRRLRSEATPAEQLKIDSSVPEPWQTRTRRSLGRLRSFFLLCEDP